MRKRTFAAVAGVAGGLGVAASLAASAATGALPPLPTLSVTTPVATATVAVPPPPPVTTTVTATTPVATATAALPPPPPPVETVVSAVTTAAAPVTTTATPVAGAVGGSATPAPPIPASAPSSSSQPAAATSGATAAGAGTYATEVTATRSQVRAAPTFRARPQPGRGDTRRLVLTLRRPRELTVLFRGPGDTCRVAGRLVVHGRRGTNVVPLNGRVRGGRLAAGVFRVEVLDTTGGAPRVLGKLAVSLRYDARGRPHVRQVRYLPRDCSLGVAALLASSRLVAGERATGGPASTPTQPVREASPPAAADEPVDVGGARDEGGLAALPNLAPGDAVGRLAAALLVGLFVLSAGGFLLVAGSSAYRRLRG